jgi:hypothetical protein
MFSVKIDNNWYEGERNGMVGILPTSYVEILPNESTVSQDIVSLHLSPIHAIAPLKVDGLKFHLS